MPASKKVTSTKPNYTLQEERLQRGWTQQEVANRISTTVVNVSRWERGVTSPSPHFRQQLSALFEKDADALGLFPAQSVVQDETLLGSSDEVAPASEEERETPVAYVSPQSLYHHFLRRRRILAIAVVGVLVLVVGSNLMAYYHFFSPSVRATQPFTENVTAHSLLLAHPDLLYSFEDGGTDNWVKAGHILSLQNSTVAGGYDGTHALQLVFSSRRSTDLPYISVNPTSNQPQSKQLLSAALFVPGRTSTTIAAKLYVQDEAYSWHSSPYTLLTPGKWNVLQFTIPAFAGRALQVGVQFLSRPPNIATTIYVDAIEWE